MIHMKKCLGQGMGEGAQSFHVLSVVLSSRNLHMFHCPEIPQTRPFKLFIEISLHGHDC
jgi:hypothetical protein